MPTYKPRTAARERHAIFYSQTCRQDQLRAVLFRPGHHPRTSADGQSALLPGVDAFQADRLELEGPSRGLAQFQGCGAVVRRADQSACPEVSRRRRTSLPALAVA